MGCLAFFIVVVLVIDLPPMGIAAIVAWILWVRVWVFIVAAITVLLAAGGAATADEGHNGEG